MWLIKNWSLYKERTTLRSPRIVIFKKDVQSHWDIELVQSASKLDFGICLASTKMADTCFDMTLSVRNSEGEEIFGPIKREKVNKGELMQFRTSTDILKKINSFPFDHIQVILYIENTAARHNGSTYDNNERLYNLKKDFANLLQNEDFSDVTIISSEGDEFKAHKSILSARSEVFAGMFRCNLSEATTNRVPIDDVDAETMRELLSFIYSAKETPKNLAAKLLPIADRYALMDLKTICEQHLMEAISHDTACDILLLAKRICNERIEGEVVQYIANNIRSVTSTSNWKNLEETNPQLCLEVLKLNITNCL